MCFCSANVLLLLVGVSKLSYFDSQFSRIYKSATNVTMRILIQAKRMFAKKINNEIRDTQFGNFWFFDDFRVVNPLSNSAM